LFVFWKLVNSGSRLSKFVTQSGEFAMASNQATEASGDGVGKTWGSVPDFALAFGLVLALGLVFAFDRSPQGPINDDGSQESGVVVEETKGVDTIVEVEEQPPPRMAVTPAEYDNMGSLLKKLGGEYKYDDLRLEQLLSSEALSEVEILFLTCGTVPEEWLGELVSKGARANTEVRHYKPEMKERVDKTLRDFVTQGGILYASDWRFSLVASAFPEFVDHAATAVSDQQEVVAEVTDGGLQEILGKEVELHFDQPGWNSAAFRGEDVTTYLHGNFLSREGKEVSAPLLVKFTVGEGAVIFTSFHNEKQNSETEIELLRYLVFIAMTARVEMQVKKTMIAGGFSPAKKSLLNVNPGKRQFTRTYNCEQKTDLQFALAFESRGAQLKLEVVGPKGRKLQKQGTSSFTIEVKNAAVGNWKYTVTAIKVPYENFPFNLSVGAKK